MSKERSNSEFVSSRIFIVTCCLAGTITGIAVLGIGSLNTKYVFGAFLAIPFGFAFAFDIRKYMLGFFLLLVPVALNISPFYLDLNAPEPLHHGTGQVTLQIWISQIPSSILLAIWLIDVVHCKKRIRLGLAGIPALFFLGWISISIFYSPRPDLSIAMLFRIIFFFLVYLYIVNNLTDNKILHFAVDMLLIGFLFQSMLAIIQYCFHLPFSIGQGSIHFYGGIINPLEIGKVYRVEGTLGQPNTFGLYIAIMLSLAFSSFLSRGFKKGKLAFICLCFGLIALVITFSRGSWIASLVGFISCFFLLKRRKLIKLRLLSAAITIIPLIILIFIGLGKSLYLRIFASPEGTSIDRIALMQVAGEMIKARPIHGVGLNNFVAVMSKYDKTGISRYFPMPVHNYFMLLAAESGLVGLSLFAGIVLIITVSGFSSKWVANHDVGSISIGALGGLWAILAANMVDAQLVKYVGGIIFWILLGIISACVECGDPQRFKVIRHRV